MWRMMKGLLGLSLLMLLTLVVCAQAATDLYLAPFGDDRDPGTIGQPVVTMGQALALAQAQIQNGATGPITIWLREGTYPIRNTLTINGLGSVDTPITFRAYPGEQARLSGGVQLNPTAFKTVTDSATVARIDPLARSKVYQINLRAQGVTDFGEMHARGFGYPIVAAPLELFFNKKPMTLARWPNTGYSTLVGVVGDGATSNIFTYSGDRPLRWRTAEDPWLYGFWHWNWADMTLKLAGIDTANRQLTLSEAPKYGLLPGARFYALNMLEELDMPGEWYLNRSTGILYFWPPQALNRRADVAVSVMSDPFISLQNANYITFMDLIFEYGRGPVIQIIGGSNNSIATCTLRNLGSLGVVIGEGDSGNVVGRYRGHLYMDTAWNRNAGTNNGIKACDIFNTGEGAVVLGGGDRKTLTRGDNYLINTHITNVNRTSATSMAAVMVDGVGQHLSHNYIHEGPYTGIMLSGNDHLIDYNYTCRMVLDTDDAGAFYMGRNPSEQGTVVKFNYWQEIGSASFTNTKAVFLDDGTCGTQVFGNVFYKAVNPNATRMGAVFVNGGKDNIVDNCIFVECRRGAGFYLWGATNWKNFLQGTYLTNVIPQRLHGDVEISQPPYCDTYPLLTTLDQNQGVNTVCRNLGYKTGAMVDVDGQTVENNWLTNMDPGFRNASALQFDLLSTSQVYTKIPGFQPVPFSQMGLYLDAYRKSRPYLPHSAELNPRR